VTAAVTGCDEVRRGATGCVEVTLYSYNVWPLRRVVVVVVVVVLGFGTQAQGPLKRTKHVQLRQWAGLDSVRRPLAMTEPHELSRGRLRRGLFGSSRGGALQVRWGGGDGEKLFWRVNDAGGGCRALPPVHVLCCAVQASQVSPISPISLLQPVQANVSR
jgi:hypothetical protein